MDNPSGLVSVVKHLEEAVGQRVGYKVLEPFSCVTVNGTEPAIITIQTAGKIIATHVGLGDLTFIIAVTPHPPSTAGHIELRYGEPGVFVEISDDICGFQDAVLATLCHEISHKFLHANGIRYGSLQVEQEIMTDVAAVYLGLGKLMLNGCECVQVEGVRANGETKTKSTLLKTGYIDRNSLAFVYWLICAMRQIPRDTYLKDLTQLAKDSLLRCEAQYGAWFHPNLHVSSKAESLIAESYSVVEGQQFTAAEMDKTLRSIGERVQSFRVAMKRLHTPLAEAKKSLRHLETMSSPNPHLRFLEHAEIKHNIDLTLAANQREIQGIRSSWSKVIKAEALLKPPGEPLTDTEIVTCPIDDTRLRVPTGREKLLVTCGKCQYQFLVIPTKKKVEPSAFGSLKKTLGRWRSSE